MQEISFIVNGIPRKVIVDPQRSLLKVIREDLRLTGTKDGCSAGHCGTCAVLMDGEVVLSCKVPVTKVQGKEITTIEGIGTLGNPHPLQLAFARAGAIQCGFCTPGMIVRAKSILDKNLDPLRDEIKKALQPHICRCTGYQKIFEAIELASSYLRGKTKSIELKLTGKEIIGQPVTRPDALEKATGTTLYAADLTVDGCAHIKVLRSPHHHAKIIQIDKKEAEAIPGVLTVLTAEDVKGTNILKMAGDDQPILCKDKVRFVGDPVAAVVANSEEIAAYAIEKIEVTYEPLDPVLTPEEALKGGAIKVHDDRANLFFEQPIIHGDIKKGLSESEVVVEKTFTTQSVEHAYLENDAGVAYVDENGKLIVMSASQNIHAHRRTISDALGVSLDKVRVIQTPTGGTFGGKLDVSVGGILGLAALKLKRPVKLVYTRSHILQHGPVAPRVPKAHAAHPDGRVGARQARGIHRAVGGHRPRTEVHVLLPRLAENRLDARHRCRAALEQIRHPAQGHHRPDEHREVDLECDQLAQRDPPLHDRGASEAEDHGSGDPPHEGEDRTHRGPDPDHRAIPLEVVLVNPPEGPELTLLLHVCLHDADAGQRLLSLRGHRREGLLDSLVVVVEPRPQPRHGEREHGERQERDQGEPSVDPAHQGHCHRERRDRVREVHEARPQEIAHGVEIVRCPREIVPHLGPPVRRGREAHHVREEIIPELVLHPARGADERHAHREQEHALEGHGDEDERGVPQHRVARRAGLQVVHGQAHDPRGRDLEEIREEDGDTTE